MFTWGMPKPLPLGFGCIFEDRENDGEVDKTSRNVKAGCISNLFYLSVSRLFLAADSSPSKGSLYRKEHYMENYGMATVVTITIIAYLVGEAVKLLPYDVNKWIPVICGFVGGCLGAVGLHVIPDFPATDYMTAIAVGIVSGFAATGVHQVYRQLYPDEDDDAWM